MGDDRMMGSLVEGGKWFFDVNFFLEEQVHREERD